MDMHSGWRRLARWLGWGIVVVAAVSTAWNISDIVLRGGQSNEATLARDVQGVIQETLQPRHVKVWLVEAGVQRDVT